MYESLNQLCEEEKTTGTPFWKLVQQEECKELQKAAEVSEQEMLGIYQAMRASYEDYEDKLQSASGLVGGEGAKLYKKRMEGTILCGDFIGRVMEKALKISESNACMKRIVAAPTAGSCGVVPAVFLSIQEHQQLSDERMVEALYVAGGIGGVIASRASLSGAAGGCQAEIGAASAMAAGGLAYLQGGAAEDISNAAALALKSLLGLACDPVAGLVEVPCVKRNVLGAVNAVTAADMTLAGIVSKIPADEVFDAMYNIGKHMDEEIRETAKGGLATTPTGMRISEKIVMQ
ncbi:MAG: L-serine ammonia-lyase, iron-sulfur-dependent, subunit alpha [bacterium]|nr:L-serine ammonia-lyase, iron-sulfur-dependent, subunit alpha [bacterium]MDY4099595.1 L-serine ammonia-lyase, iron-sulfur-dependent, subunit alpha [Lachnospiraceae bacterium]